MHIIYLAIIAYAIAIFNGKGLAATSKYLFYAITEFENLCTLIEQSAYQVLFNMAVTNYKSTELYAVEANTMCMMSC